MNEREFPQHPRVGVGVVALRNREVLLVERQSEPLSGFWSFPGGAVELGESLRAAAVREMREETGLEVEIVDIADVFERVDREPDGRIRFHYIVVDFLARIRPGSGTEPEAASDASQARWIQWERLADLPVTPGVERVLARARQLLDRAEAPEMGLAGE